MENTAPARNEWLEEAPEGFEYVILLGSPGVDTTIELRPLSQRLEAEERGRQVRAAKAEAERLARIQWEKDMEDYW